MKINKKEGQPEVDDKEKQSQWQKEQYLAGMKRYQERGILIKIDGKESEEHDWGRILEAREDNSFYMADFVVEEKTGKLTEIHFDRVYHS